MALVLAACTTPLTIASLGSSAAMWLSKPGAPGPADTADQIKPHESWCYETMGYPECYAEVQDTDPNRLINVDPENLYPLTPRDYKEAVFMENGGAPVSAASIPVSTATGSPTNLTATPPPKTESH
jgi:hypothetical protein